MAADRHARIAAFSPTDIEALGYVYPKQLADGTWIALQLMVSGGCGLHLIVDEYTCARYWSYPSLADAIMAQIEWDGQGDPPGIWNKEKPSQRLGPWALDPENRNGPVWTVRRGTGRTVQRQIGIYANAEDAAYAAAREMALVSDPQVNRLMRTAGHTETFSISAGDPHDPERTEPGAWIEIERQEEPRAVKSLEEGTP